MISCRLQLHNCNNLEQQHKDSTMFLFTSESTSEYLFSIKTLLPPARTGCRSRTQLEPGIPRPHAMPSSRASVLLYLASPCYALFPLVWRTRRKRRGEASQHPVLQSPDRRRSTWVIPFLSWAFFHAIHMFSWWFFTNSRLLKKERHCLWFVNIVYCTSAVCVFSHQHLLGFVKVQW
jgi:hypothetical protein